MASRSRNRSGTSSVTFLPPRRCSLPGLPITVIPLDATGIDESGEDRTRKACSPHARCSPGRCRTFTNCGTKKSRYCSIRLPSPRCSTAKHLTFKDMKLQVDDNGLTRGARRQSEHARRHCDQGGRLREVVRGSRAASAPKRCPKSRRMYRSWSSRAGFRQRSTSPRTTTPTSRSGGGCAARRETKDVRPGGLRCNPRCSRKTSTTARAT